MGSSIEITARKIAALGTRHAQPERGRLLRQLLVDVANCDSGDPRFREQAKAQWGNDGEIEIDDDAVISTSRGEGADGAYVAAWVWVYRSDLPRRSREGSKPAGRASSQSPAGKSAGG